MCSGCAYHCAAGTGVLAFDYARRSGCSREASERASERLQRAIPWNGMERNGMARVLQNISFHRISAPQLYTSPGDSSTTLEYARSRRTLSHFSSSTLVVIDAVIVAPGDIPVARCLWVWSTYSRRRLWSKRSWSSSSIGTVLDRSLCSPR